MREKGTIIKNILQKRRKYLHDAVSKRKGKPYIRKMIYNERAYSRPINPRKSKKKPREPITDESPTSGTDSNTQSSSDGNISFSSASNQHNPSPASTSSNPSPAPRKKRRTVAPKNNGAQATESVISSGTSGSSSAAQQVVRITEEVLNVTQY